MSSAVGYSRTQIRLHWIIAALIVLQYLLNGPITEAWKLFTEGGDPARSIGVFQHVAIGGTVLLLAVWRLVLRLRHGAVPLPEEEKPLLRLLSKAVHVALYALMFMMPLSGLSAWFGGIENAAKVHSALRVALLVLVVLHVLGALFHKFVLKSGVFERMIRPV
jgi:cytochrome b561